MKAWKAAWSYLPIDYGTNVGVLENTTQRTRFHNNLNGDKLRVKFTNRYSTQPLVMEKVIIGCQKEKNGIISELQPVTCKGEQRVILAADTECYSDEIEMQVAPGEDIVISVYYKEKQEIQSACCTWAARSWSTIYICGEDVTMEQNYVEKYAKEVYDILAMDPHPFESVLGICEIDVETDESVKTLVMFGDSITHMSYYSDALLERLYNHFPGQISVINRGIGGNRLLHNAIYIADLYGNGKMFGEAGMSRFAGNVFETEKVEWVFILIGVNDLMQPYLMKHLEEAVSAHDLQEGISKLINLVHSHGSKVMLGTVMPFGASGYMEDYSLAEKERQVLNDWIREQTIADGVLDFDRIMRMPDKPDHLQENLHLGDNLHPNDKGGLRMASIVPLDIFEN